MMRINLVVVSGVLVKDAEVIQKDDYMIINMSIAHNKNKKVNNEWKQDTSFFNVTFMTKSYNTAKLTKGSMIIVRGELKQDTWQTQDGSKRSRIKIMAQQIDMVKQSNAEIKQEEEAPQEQDIPF